MIIALSAGLVVGLCVSLVLAWLAGVEESDNQRWTMMAVAGAVMAGTSSWQLQDDGLIFKLAVSCASSLLGACVAVLVMTLISRLKGPPAEA